MPCEELQAAEPTCTMHWLQAVLAGLERPLLCSSVHVEAGVGALELPEAAVMLDMFKPRGIDFVVDAGVTVRPPRPCLWLHGVLWGS